MDTERNLFISAIVVLLCFGALMVHSASMTSRPSEVEQIFLSRHLMFIGIGVVLSAAASRVPVRWWQVLAPWLFWGVLLLLVMVLVPGLGAKVNGARRWFRSGSLSGQPSELMKIALPLFVCCLAARNRAQLSSWRTGVLPVAYPILLAVPLVMVEPDLGTALFLASVGAGSLFVSGWPVRNFLVAAGLAVPAVIATILRRPYQMQRISGFMETWADWTQAPYHLKQSLVTLGAGGACGVGLGKGFQKLSFLPEANTDFVFAVIGEELGLLGALSVIVLWLAVYVLGLRLLRAIPRETFAYNAAFMLLSQIVFQVALNVAVVTAMVPPKGIPHPLISYGGSNLVVSLLAFGVFLSLTRPQAESSSVMSPVESTELIADLDLRTPAAGSI
ncbi:MAG: cell division protein FtsW [Planctomycetes bacterium]|nr:cell division protein FtsW [Planctomycetota bacterium]